MLAIYTSSGLAHRASVNASPQEHTHYPGQETGNFNAACCTGYLVLDWVAGEVSLTLSEK